MKTIGFLMGTQHFQTNPNLMAEMSVGLCSVDSVDSVDSTCPSFDQRNQMESNWWLFLHPGLAQVI